MQLLRQLTALLQDQSSVPSTHIVTSLQGILCPLLASVESCRHVTLTHTHMHTHMHAQAHTYAQTFLFKERRNNIVGKK